MNQPSACVPANNCGVYSGLILIVTMVSIQILAVSSSYWSDCVTDVITSEDICHHSGARAAALHHRIIAANSSGNQEIQPEHRAAQSQAFYLSQHLITPGHYSTLLASCLLSSVSTQISQFYKADLSSPLIIISEESSSSEVLQSQD